MNPMDMGPFAGIFSGIQQRMQTIKEEASSTQVTGVAGGGLVKVIATADHDIVRVEISPEVMDDKELLEDLLRAATNEAVRKGKAEMAGKLEQLTGGLPLPPGLIPGL